MDEDRTIGWGMFLALVIGVVGAIIEDVIDRSKRRLRPSSYLQI